MKRFYIISLLALAVTGCSKKEKWTDDHTAPVITVISPTNHQVFTNGQTVNISMQVEDSQKIFLVHVHISDNGTGQLLTDIHRYPDDPVYTLAESFVAKAGIEYKIQVIARDTGGNESNQTIFVSAT